MNMINLLLNSKATKNNTKELGVARGIIFCDRLNKKYTAVCLDFDIIEEADTFDEADKQIREAMKGYILNVVKNNLDDSLLNRHAPVRFWRMYKKSLQKELKQISELKASNTEKTPDIITFKLPVENLLHPVAC